MGDQPVRRWITEQLPRGRRLAIIAALGVVLGRQGVGVCQSEWGKPLGDGLFEFRVRLSESEVRTLHGGRSDPASSEADAVLLRVFFHPYGDKIVLLLAGYDKGADPSAKRQQREISVARARLREFTRGRRAPATLGGGVTRAAPRRSFLAWRRSRRPGRPAQP